MIYYVYTWESQKDGGLYRCDSVNAYNLVSALESVDRPAGMVVSIYDTMQREFASIPNVCWWSQSFAKRNPNWTQKIVDFS